MINDNMNKLFNSAIVNYTIACFWRQLCSFENRLVRVDHDQGDLKPEGEMNIIADYYYYYHLKP